MDSRITVRFYTVFPLEPGQPSFDACLKKILGIGQNVVRDVNGADIQISSMVKNNKRISGDLLRLQDQNLPSLVNRGKKPQKMALKTGVALGHHTAFVYDASLRILAFQLTRNAVPLSLFNGFVTTVCSCERFGFGPVIKAAELQQLNKVKPKTLIVKVADPSNLEAVEDDQRTLRRSLLNLRNLAEGAYVRVQIGLGNNLGEMNKGRILNTVTWLLGQRDLKRGKVHTIQVVGKDVNEQDLPLDFIRYQVGESQDLPLGGAVGLDENYKFRSEFMLDSLDRHADELRAYQAGPKPL